MGLPGVRVGPLDPDATESFGQVSKRNSARQLIKLHGQMYPPALKRALVRPRDDARSEALDHDEVVKYIAGLTHENGDPVIPEGAEYVPGSAAVRGERRGEQILTFLYQLPSGRTGKWHAPYSKDVLPTSHDQGTERVRVEEYRERGLVPYGSDSTRAQILERQLAETRSERDRLREYVKGGGQGDPPEESGDGPDRVELANQEGLAAQLEDANREREELRQRLAQFEALSAAQGGGLSTSGIEETIPPEGSNVRTENEPVAGYDNLKADEAVKLLRDENTDEETRQRILAYERTHANRKSVTSAGEQSLG